MMFLHIAWLLAILLLPIFWFVFRPKSYVAHSNVPLIDTGLKQTRFHKVPLVLFLLAVASLIFALANPQKRIPHGTTTIKSRDIIVAVDISGSMGMTFDGKVPEPEKGNTELDKEFPGRPSQQVNQNDLRYGRRASANDIGKRRIDAAQAAVTRFVRHRFTVAAGDRIGIMMFDESPHWSWPLTDDLKMIYRKGVFVDQGLGGGTNFGNINPGPIDAAGEHFDERGQAASKVFIMVTDGEDRIDGSAMSRLFSEITSRGIRFYLISVGSQNSSQDSAILQLAASVNGQVFRVQNAQSLVQCFDSIDQMERSPVAVNIQATYETRFYYFAAAAILLCILALVSESIIVHP